jgi:release factor glutamine methyltransferase
MNLPLPGTFEDALKISKQALSKNSEILRKGSLETEAEQLVIGAYRQVKGRAKSFGRSDLYMLVMQPYPKDAGTVLIDFLTKRVDGVPIQYILGYQTFLYHEYFVDENVLIPRPETESLVYEIVQTFKRSVEQPTEGFELGLGSGCISIELLKIFPTLNMTATEVSVKAIEVAKKNREKILGSDERLKIVPVGSEEVFPGSFKTSALNRFDFMVSNPPYLGDKSEMDDDVWDNEPHAALLAPADDALYYYRHMIEESFSYLKPNGVLFFEIPHERSGELYRLGAAWGKTEIIPDLAGRDRILKLRRKLNG